MIRLVENFSAYKDIIKELPLTEASITEKDTGKKYETKKKFRVDISRFTENLNKRIYSKGLWENVIKSQKHIWEGSFALADHPTDEGSFKDVMGVWSNLHINEDTDTVRADITFVGPYGAKALEILEAGGKIGFSSSGFGDLKEDGKTVDESTYQIERIADCVLNPSQQVYGTIKDVIEEKTTNYSSTIKEDTKEHIKMSSNKLSKFEERKFRESINFYFAEALKEDKTSDIRLKELNELMTYFDEGDNYTDLKEMVEKEIENTHKAIKEAIVKASSLKETFGTDNPEEFKEGLAKLATDSQLYERQLEDWKKLAEGLQKTIKELKEELEKKPSNEQVENLKDRIKFIKESQLKKEVSLNETIRIKDKHLDENAKIYQEMVGELKRVVDALAESESINEELYTKNKSLLKEINESKKQISNLREVYEKKIADLTKLPEVKHSDPKKMFNNFNENNKVKKYYEDLEKQHGSDIIPYKEKIVSCKTLFEAMRVYTNALNEMTSDIYISKSGDETIDRTRIEEATGYKINPAKSRNVPEGWD